VNKRNIFFSEEVVSYIVILTNKLI